MRAARPITERLPWHERQWRSATAALEANRMPHAFLLAGVSGIGKSAFAEQLAATVLCEQDSVTACGVCHSCRELANGAHPGFTVLRRDTERRDIPIDAVRALCTKLTLTSHDQGTKLAVIDTADDLNRNGVNALLKTLEEPTPGTVLLLLSERPLALPATLRSRCQQLRFVLPDSEQALAWLNQQFPETESAELRLALAAAHGAPLRAAEYLDHPEILEVFATWSSLMDDLEQPHGEPLAVAAQIGKEQGADFLDWLAVRVHQRLSALLGVTDAAAEPDWQKARVLGRFGEAICTARKNLYGNANVQLTIEALLIRWHATLARQRRAR